MKGVELYGQVRRAVYVEGLSRREAARRFGIDPRTVAKMLAFSVPPGYRRGRPPARPKLDPFVGIIDRILEEDKGQPAKQQHTSKRIFERLRDEHGYRRRDHDRKGLRARAPAAVARDVRAVAARPGARAGRLRRSAGGDRWSGAEDPLLRDGSAAQRRLPGAGLSGGEQRGLLRGTSRQLRVLRRGAALDPVRQPQAGGGAHPGRWPAASGLGSSASCSRTTCSPTASDDPARATTRARSKGWWATRGATSWCRFRTRPASRNSTRSCWSTAGVD